MEIMVTDRKGVPLLGKDRRAEELIIWSEKHKVGSRWVKDLACGLRLVFVAAKLEPKMYIYWNQQKFYTYLEQLGEQDRFVLVTYGFCIEHCGGITKVRLLGAGDTGSVLWDTLENPFSRQHSFKDPKDSVNWLVGLLKFTEKGPLLGSGIDCQQEVEEATALAVIDTSVKKQEKIKTVGEVLPVAKHSEQTKQFLLRDVALNVLLKIQAGGAK